MQVNYAPLVHSFAQRVQQQAAPNFASQSSAQLNGLRQQSSATKATLDCGGCNTTQVIGSSGAAPATMVPALKTSGSRLNIQA